MSIPDNDYQILKLTDVFIVLIPIHLTKKY